MNTEWIHDWLEHVGQFACSIPAAISLGVITAVVGLLLGLARKRLIDGGEGHLGHFMVGGELIVAAISVSVAEYATRVLFLSCCGTWTQRDAMQALKFAGIAFGILYVLMLSINHERVGLAQGPKVSFMRVATSNFWGIVTTLVAVGTATQWAFFR